VEEHVRIAMYSLKKGTAEEAAEVGGAGCCQSFGPSPVRALRADLDGRRKCRFGERLGHPRRSRSRERFGREFRRRESRRAGRAPEHPRRRLLLRRRRLSLGTTYLVPFGSGRFVAAECLARCHGDRALRARWPRRCCRGWSRQRRRWPAGRGVVDRESPTAGVVECTDVHPFRLCTAVSLV
jgi:hypothetical protein